MSDMRSQTGNTPDPAGDPAASPSAVPTKDLNDLYDLIAVAVALGAEIPAPPGTVIYEAILGVDDSDTYNVLRTTLGFYPTYEDALDTIYTAVMSQFDIRRGRPYLAPWLHRQDEIRRQILTPGQRFETGQRFEPDKLDALIAPVRAAWEAAHPDKLEQLNLVDPKLCIILKHHVKPGTQHPAA